VRFNGTTEIGGAENGTVVFRTKGDRGLAEKYFYRGRVLLGDMKRRMQLNTNIKWLEEDHQQHDGAWIHVQSNRYGLADIDEVWVDVTVLEGTASTAVIIGFEVYFKRKLELADYLLFGVAEPEEGESFSFSSFFYHHNEFFALTDHHIDRGHNVNINWQPLREEVFPIWSVLPEIDHFGITGDTEALDLLSRTENSMYAATYGNKAILGKYSFDNGYIGGVKRHLDREEIITPQVSEELKDSLDRNYLTAATLSWETISSPSYVWNFFVQAVTYPFGYYMWDNNLGVTYPNYLPVAGDFKIPDSNTGTIADSVPDQKGFATSPMIQALADRTVHNPHQILFNVPANQNFKDGWYTTYIINQFQDGAEAGATYVFKMSDGTDRIIDISGAFTGTDYSGVVGAFNPTDGKFNLYLVSSTTDFNAISAVQNAVPDQSIPPNAEIDILAIQEQINLTFSV
jgi:hypothetical protein